MSQEKRLHVRLDEGLLNAAQQFAEDAGISMNQLVRGLLHWVVEDGRPGREPFLNDDGELVEREQAGCFWVGLPQSDSLPKAERERIARKMGISVGDMKGRSGYVNVVMDYSERRAVRRDPFIDLSLQEQQKKK